MRELSHARKARVLHEDGRIESSPGVLVVSPANHFHIVWPVHESDGSAVHANESLAIVVDERQEISFLLGVHLEVAPSKEQYGVKIVQVLRVVFQLLLG